MRRDVRSLAQESVHIISIAGDVSLSQSIPVASMQLIERLSPLELESWFLEETGDKLQYSILPLEGVFDLARISR